MLSKLLASALIGTGTGLSPVEPVNRPNVLFMFGDDHGQADIPWENKYLEGKFRFFISFIT